MTSGADWQGRVGEEWARRAEALDALLGPVGAAGLAALGEVSGRRVLDLGCGAGASTRALAARGAKVTGLDLSAPLLAVARARGGAVQYRHDDAAHARFDTPFQALYSRFGTMFFDDPVGAFTHLRGQMVPGGKAVMVAWCGRDQNPWAQVPLDAVAEFLPDQAAEQAAGPGPFAWADRDVFQAILEAAGWSSISAEAITCDAILSAGDDPDPARRATEFATAVGPLASRLRGLPPELRGLVRARLTDIFRPMVVDGAVRIGTRAWIISAQG